MDTARLYAAICRTCLYLQSNYHLLSVRKFNLLDHETRWTGDQRLLIIRDGPDGQMFLNPDRFQDACVDVESRDMLRQLEMADDDSTKSIVEEDLTNKYEEDLPKKKRVTIHVD